MLFGPEGQDFGVYSYEYLLGGDTPPFLDGCLMMYTMMAMLRLSHAGVRKSSVYSPLFEAVGFDARVGSPITKTMILRTE